MLNLLLNYDNKNLNLLPVNKKVHLLLKQVDIAKKVLSWTSTKFVQIFYVTAAASFLFPIAVMPAAFAAVAILVADVAVSVLARFKKVLSQKKSEIYSSHTFLDLSEQNLGFKTEAGLEASKLKKNPEYLRLPVKIQNLIIEYSEEKKMKTLREVQERLSISVELGSLPSTGNDHGYHNIRNTNIKSKQLQTELKKLYTDFQKKCLLEMYGSYQKSQLEPKSCKVILMDPKQYKAKVIALMYRIKKIKMLVSFSELTQNPLNVESDVSWMEKNLPKKLFR